MTIGEKIKEIRKNKNLAIKQVSEKCGIPGSKITFYETDKGMPTIPTLQKLAEGLDCSIFDIIEESLGRSRSKCIHAEKCMFYDREVEENKELNGI
ncbi:MAG: helix-turn-helix domain-containing protein [Candidatus Improbicoccus devescovinae]|nr:MAG: helix-turn-helix domain-containing protein [Candidatus Improbicoccus devescovinae]